ncbi:hypothetical protein NUW58_g8628 [Xylaria curta]|uniref:Uncharacterized protein n=1 Tax=Xylaria curta TaxID=42375 RepID=A0ACC1N6Q1_9PEZI|nr:hypothetical protein NUW58_g8628 [Xylaria curta]
MHTSDHQEPQETEASQTERCIVRMDSLYTAECCVANRGISEHAAILATPKHVHLQTPTSTPEDTATNGVPQEFPGVEETIAASDTMGLPQPRSEADETPSPHHPPVNPGFGITWDQAERAVEDFTTIFTAHFPFIILDHDITAPRLCLEKPLLFRAILMMAIDFSLSKSREIRRSIDAWIGQHLLVLEEQSLGVLQGLVVYIAWSNPHFYFDHRPTQLMYLAVGLAHSLGITRPPARSNTPVKTETEINEEHRTFLACYYLLSFNSFQFGRPNPLSSSYVQDCVDSLERSCEFSTDFLLVKLVKFRQFIGRVPTVYQGLRDTKWRREISSDASDQLEEVRKDLDDLISDVSHKHPKLLLLWSLQHSALLQLHLPMTYAVPDSEGTSHLQLECMQHCLQASHAFATMAKSFCSDGFLYAPFTTFVDLVSMLIATSRVLLLDVDGWGLKNTQQRFDLRTAIDDVVVKLTSATEVKAKRVAAAAASNPSSYIPDGPDEEKHDKLRIFMRLVESIRNWVESHNASPSSYGELGQDRVNESRASTRVHVSPQSPQWNFTYFFESLLQIDQSSVY